MNNTPFLSYRSTNDGKLDEKYKPTVANMVGWQFTSKAKVDGISGNVDLNVWYGKTASNTSTTTSTATQKVSEYSMKTIS